MSIDIKALHLPDETFWGSSDRASDPVVRKYKTSHFGVFIDAPGEVHLKNKSTLPVFVYYMGEFKQLATRDFDNDALIVAMDVERNALSICSASSADAGEDPDPDWVPPPPGPIGNGYNASIRTIEVRERLEFPWKPGRFIFQIVLLDLVSPRVETRLIGSTSEFEDVEVEKFLEAERAAKNPPAPFPRQKSGAKFPSYEKADDSPEMPAEFGVSLAAQRVVPLDGNTPLLLHGAWRLPVQPEEMVKADRTEFNKANGLLTPGGTPYAAVATVHLLIVGTADNSPRIYALSLPVASTDEGAASGYFTVNLLDLPEMPVMDQTLFIYAYSREWAAEPVVIGVLDRRPEPQPEPEAN